MKTEYKLNVLGRSLTILSEDEPDHVTAMETLVNERVARFTSGTAGPNFSALLLATLHLADELLKEQATRTELKEKIRSKSEKLLQQLDNISFAS